MSEEPANLVLTMLRGICGTLDEHSRKFDEVISRLGRLERETAGLKLEVAHLHGDFATLSERIDNLDRRFDRVERRLDLVEDPAP